MAGYFAAEDCLDLYSLVEAIASDLFHSLYVPNGLRILRPSYTQ